MEQSGYKDPGKKKICITTFPVPFPFKENQENMTNAPTKDSKEKLIKQAFSFHLQGNIQAAAKYYEYFINQGFKDHRVLSNYGKILNDLGKSKDAELSCRKAIKIKPNYAEAHYNLGIILSDLGKLKDAELSYRKAIQIKPDFANAHSNLGNILSDIGKLKEAALSQRKAIEIKPDYVEAHYNLGIIFKDLGKLKNAELSYRKAIEIKPNFAEAHYNLGNILKDFGKLKEAELSYRKAIEIKPNYAEAHYNLGIIFSDLGKLQDAELSYRKAIEIKPYFANAHSNLGNILSDLGKLQDAELSYHKAIEIKPNFAEAHYNMGNILKDFGKLQDAELSYRKAIELKPDYAEAHYNLGIILSYLGKLKELICLSKSTLAIRSINQGDKLQASLQVTITNLLKGNFTEVLSNLNQTNKLIKQGGLSFIKNKKNKKHTLIYSKLISLLYPLLEKGINNPNSARIPHIGESHCLSFAHQTLSISSQIQKIQPVLITGGKAWHFGNKKNNQWKDSLTQQIKNHKYNDKVFISFGEIDCRKNEGILTVAIKKNKDIAEVCEKTIKSYLDYMETTLSLIYSKRYYFGVPTPTKKELPDELDLKRIKMIKLYNRILKREVLSRDSYFLDVYNLTSAQDGQNNNMYMYDGTHLSPKCLSILFEKYLYEPNNIIS